MVLALVYILVYQLQYKNRVHEQAFVIIVYYCYDANYYRQNILHYDNNTDENAATAANYCFKLDFLIYLAIVMIVAYI